MSFYKSAIADILIAFVTAFTQILIARRLFSKRKKLPAPVFGALAGVLSVLCTVLMFATLFRFPSLGLMLSGMPVIVRSVLIATGNIWGVTSVASFAIYNLYRFFSSR